ncbi:hypothetical protein BJY52DRAFT_1232453 [Lactarius psammicola]|nr:hypothetical protein BJY52DRAFT_1232453 [Lactarius psammicola]
MLYSGRAGEPTPSNGMISRGNNRPFTLQPRTIVLCFDGTGDQFDADNTNVVRFCSTLDKGDKDQQMVYYQRPHSNSNASPVWRRDVYYPSSRNTDPSSFPKIRGYEFLMENYHTNDKICIFGFSRGAYTARALAGMIHKVNMVGLLPAGNSQQVPFAYRMYTRDDKDGWKQSKQFKEAFSMDVGVEFLGVWDTVCSVGFIPRELPLTASNTTVRFFRHALALDERRATFRMNYWHRRSRDHYDDEERPQTDVREVWFAGCHADVGGGSVPNSTENSLARISLRWMILECFRTGTGIRFRKDALKRIGMDQKTLTSLPGGQFTVERARPQRLATDVTVVPSPPHSAFSTEQENEWLRQDFVKDTDIEGTLDSKANVSELPTMSKEMATMTGSSAFKTEHELKDALSPIYDQLKIWKIWWLPEVIPLRHRVHGLENLSALRGHHWSVNFGRPRKIMKPIREGEKILVHRSVELRMNAEKSKLGAWEKANTGADVSFVLYHNFQSVLHANGDRIKHISGIQSTVNDGLFKRNAVSAIFNGTILEQSAQDFLACGAVGPNAGGGEQPIELAAGAILLVFAPPRVMLFSEEVVSQQGVVQERLASGVQGAHLALIEKTTLELAEKCGGVFKRGNAFLPRLPGLVLQNMLVLLAAGGGAFKAYKLAGHY